MSLSKSEEGFVKADEVEQMKPVEKNKDFTYKKMLLAGNTIMLSMEEVKPGFEEKPPYTQHDFEEIVYVLQGKFEMIYPETGKRWIMEPGSAKLHPIGTKHKVKNLANESAIVLLVRGPRVPILLP